MLARVSWLDRVTGSGNISIKPLEWLPLEFLCFNLRAIDREELVGNLPTENPLEIASIIFNQVARNGCAWCGFMNGRPAAVLGVFENFPGNWQVFSFGSNDYVRVLVCFRQKWPLMLAYVRDHGGHRIECRSLATHSEAHGFLRLMRFEREGVLRCYGRRKQDYVQFARLVA